MRWVKLTLPPRWRRRWLLSTSRLTSSCRAIPARGLPVGSRLGCPLRVLDGSSRLGRPLSFLASRSRGRRLLGPGSGSRGRGRGFPRLLARCSLGLLGLVLGEELAPCLTHRGGVVEVLPVDVIDQPHVG